MLMKSKLEQKVYKKVYKTLSTEKTFPGIKGDTLIVDSNCGKVEIVGA